MPDLEDEDEICPDCGANLDEGELHDDDCGYFDEEDEDGENEDDED